MKEIAKTQYSFYQDIKSILQVARDNAYKSVNFIMAEAYWNVGKKIVEVEQNGNVKAKYGSNLIEGLSKQLTADFGAGFSSRNIRNMRQFYICFPILQTLSAKLSWSHYRQDVGQIDMYVNMYDAGLIHSIDFLQNLRLPRHVVPRNDVNALSLRGFEKAVAISKMNFIRKSIE